MTIIAAFAQDGETWLGSDTQVTVGDRRDSVRQKWVIGNGWAVAGCGFSFGLDLMEKLVAEHDGAPPAATSFAKALRQHLLDNHVRPDYDRTPAGDFGFGLMMALPGEVWHFDDSLAVRRMDEFCAHGCGRDYAYGAFHAAHEGASMGGISLSPADAVRVAVEAATRYDVHCSGLWLGVLRRGGAFERVL